MNRVIFGILFGILSLMACSQSDEPVESKTNSQSPKDTVAILGTGDNSPEAWFLGTASDRCRNELSAAGWEVHENLVHTIAAESE